MLEKQLISVIVPIYNVEKYMKRCVDSILDQTYYNLEIILIDDGSTDDSPKICDEYAKLDERVCVIHKKNGGVSSARNAGMKRATGHYLTFVDSDDYVDQTCFEKMHYGITENNVNMVVVGWKDQNGELGKVASYCGKGDYKIIRQNEIKGFGLLSNVWGHLFNRAWLTTHYFDESVFYGEDMLFVIKNFFKNEGSRLLVIGDPLYTYVRNREDSAVNLPFNDKMISIIDANNQIVECVKSYERILDLAKRYRRVQFWDLYVKILESNNLKRYKEIRKYLKTEIISARKEGDRPLGRKENFVEFLFLYLYKIGQCYLSLR